MKVSDSERLELLIEGIRAEEFGQALVQYGRRLTRLVNQQTVADM